MKKIFTIALFMLLVGASCSTSSEVNVTPNLANFSILVETADDEIKLSCQKGCAFKELTFATITGRKQAIDQNGMTSSNRNKTVKGSDLSNFHFMIERTDEGLRFEGVEGTAWKELSFSCPENKCHAYLDQSGMADEN